MAVGATVTLVAASPPKATTGMSFAQVFGLGVLFLSLGGAAQEDKRLWVEGQVYGGQWMPGRWVVEPGEPVNDTPQGFEGGDAPSPVAAERKYKYFGAVGCYGATLERFSDIKTVAECEALCNNNDDCGAFTLIPDGKCYLKHNCCPYTQRGNKEDWVSGERVDPSPFCRDGQRRYNFIQQTKCVGDMLMSGGTRRISDCMEKCELTMGCEAFVFQWGSDDPCTLLKNCKGQVRGGYLSGVAVRR